MQGEARHDIDTTQLFTFGVISVVLFIAIIIGLQALYYGYQDSEDREKIVKSPDVEARNLLAEQEAKLNRKGWIDRGNGVIAIPIDRAMELVVQELRAEAGGDADAILQ